MSGEMTQVEFQDAINAAMRWCFACGRPHYTLEYIGDDLKWMRENCPQDVPKIGCSPWFGSRP